MRRWSAAVLDVHGSGMACRAAVACWVCFWKTDPDMWILPEHWDGLHPVVPSHRLPLLDHSRPDAWDPITYPWQHVM